MKAEKSGEPTLKNFTDCTEDELRRILGWRNSEEVRNNSFESKIIAWPDHLKFVESLRKRNDKFYFLVTDDKEPLGVISLSLKGDGSAEVGYYKTDEKPVRDIKGIGVRLLREAERAAKILGEGGIRRLITEAFAFNEASIKSITRAGYKKASSKKQRVTRDGITTEVLRYELDTDD